ncbi:H-NS family nucleoid-associated regulatory protein [Paraburkholderia sp. BCC1886]|uniref:H-NS family nucleoid-associated regulatory protein n=1 Tax=Paraburkholderia sp. BCC1886 TaxID=2562670 RepID=UPI001182BD4B|nr:H-NS family nucleoid-associated regulatory protein [Paraburkholderia sp. BCC1886]
MPTLEQIQAKLKKLQAQADVLLAKKAQAAVDQIRDLMIKHGLTTEDIEAKAKARRAAKGLGVKVAGHSAKSSGTVKYRDHKTGATWTGHGRAPGWIASVKDRTQFLVDGASELKSAARAVVTKAKTATGTKRGTGQPKGAQPPKYRDPKSGATWSGRGPAPAWLASAKDRTRFLIDSAAAAATDVKSAAKSAAKAGKAKASATSGAVSKKAAAKKVVAKKAVASKKAAVKKVAAKKVAAVKKVVAQKSTTKPAAKKAPAKKAPGRKAAAKTASTPVAAPAPQAAAAAPAEA